MARPWSARCYGVARQREGSRQNSIGGSGVLSLRHFSGWFSLSLGAWVPKNLARRRMVSAARCCSTGSGRLGLDLLISGPRVNLFFSPYAGARGANVTFLPQYLLGLKGMPRRIAEYAASDGFTTLNRISSAGSALLFLSEELFLVNFLG